MDVMGEDRLVVVVLVGARGGGWGMDEGFLGEEEDETIRRGSWETGEGIELCCYANCALSRVAYE